MNALALEIETRAEESLQQENERQEDEREALRADIEDQIRAEVEQEIDDRERRQAELGEELEELRARQAEIEDQRTRDLQIVAESLRRERRQRQSDTMSVNVQLIADRIVQRVERGYAEAESWDIEGGTADAQELRSRFDRVRTMFVSCHTRNRTDAEVYACLEPIEAALIAAGF